MESNNKSDASTFGCLLIVSSVGSCVSVFLALSQKDPRWFWGLPVAALMLWAVFAFYKEAQAPRDAIESQLSKARFDIIRLEESNANLNTALSGCKSHEASQAQIERHYTREKDKRDAENQLLKEQAEKISEERSALLVEMEELAEQRITISQQIRDAHSEVFKLRERNLVEIQDIWQKCWEEKSVGFPTIAAASTDAWVAIWGIDIANLRHRAPMTALELKSRLSKEIRRSRRVRLFTATLWHTTKVFSHGLRNFVMEHRRSTK